MKKSLIILVFIISLAAAFVLVYRGDRAGISPPGSDVVQADTKAEPAATKVPRAVFPETKYSFDTIAEGTEIKHDFIIENHGQAPLIIERVQPD